MPLAFSSGLFLGAILGSISSLGYRKRGGKAPTFLSTTRVSDGLVSGLEQAMRLLFDSEPRSQALKTPLAGGGLKEWVA